MLIIHINIEDKSLMLVDVFSSEKGTGRVDTVGTRQCVDPCMEKIQWMKKSYFSFQIIVFKMYRRRVKKHVDVRTRDFFEKQNKTQLYFLHLTWEMQYSRQVWLNDCFNSYRISTPAVLRSLLSCWSSSLSFLTLTSQRWILASCESTSWCSTTECETVGTGWSLAIKSATAVTQTLLLKPLNHAETLW